MAAEFVGYTDVRHVQQPEGSEQSYAAIVSAVSGAPIHAAQASLYRAGMVEDNGSVGVITARTRLEVPRISSIVEIDPMAQAEEPEEVLRLIDGQFESGRAVTFRHRRALDPEESSETKQHWVLFTGYPVTDGAPGPIHTINPLYEEAGYTTRSAIIEIIKRSNDYAAGGRGVFLQAISNGLASSA